MRKSNKPISLLILTLALSLASLTACDDSKARSKAQEPGAASHDHHGEHGEHGEHDHHHEGSAASKGDKSKEEGKEDEHACTCGTDVPCEACANGHGHGHGHGGHAHAKPDANEVPADQSGEGKTEGGEFLVKYKPSPNPIPFQKHFTMELEVYDAKDTSKPLEGVSIDSVKAVMPAHNHGMKVKPEIKEVSPGKFTVEGMRFHMQGPEKDGLWVLEAVVNHNGRIDQTKFEFQCCR